MFVVLFIVINTYSYWWMPGCFLNWILEISDWNFLLLSYSGFFLLPILLLGFDLMKVLNLLMIPLTWNLIQNLNNYLSLCCIFIFINFENGNLTCWKLIEKRWQPKQSTVGNQDGLKGIYRVDVDIPADDWVNITDFYDVLVFNTGHW